jgi:hypothetical protein
MTSNEIRFVELAKVRVIKVWWDKEAYITPKQVYTCKRVPGFAITTSKNTTKAIRVGQNVIVDDVRDLSKDLQTAKYKIVNQIFTKKESTV